METTATVRLIRQNEKIAAAKKIRATEYDLLLHDTSKYYALYKLVLLYIVGGTVGTLYETILNFVRGDGLVYCNGSLFTVFNPVYGIGAIMIVLALGSFKNPIAVFSIGSVMGAAVEMLLSLLEEAFLGTRSWDYTGDFLNIAGRTTVPLAIFWGILCLVVICYLFPVYNRFLNRITQKLLKKIAAVVMVVVLFDFACTAVVLFRYTARLEGMPAGGSFSRFIDEHFGNDFMQTRFPQMKKPGEPGVKQREKRRRPAPENKKEPFARSVSLNGVDSAGEKGYTLLRSVANFVRTERAYYVRA